MPTAANMSLAGSQPQLRDIILRGSDSIRVERRFGKRGRYGPRTKSAGEVPLAALQNAVRIDRGLAVLGGDDDQRRFKQAPALQFAHHLADAGIDELDLIQHIGQSAFQPRPCIRP